jgi:hypothetical protein
MGRVFDENALPAMPVSLSLSLSLSSTQADVPTRTPAGIAVPIPGRASLFANMGVARGTG